MFRKIFVPLDGSPLAENALPFALCVARAARAELHIAMVHVPDVYSRGDEPGPQDREVDAREREQQYLDALADNLAAILGGPVTVHHPEGIVQETLIAEVAEHGVDLVVMNAHGWDFVSRAILGSVSDYLMRHLPIPLLLTHSHPTTTELQRVVALRKVLICLDGSELAEAILEPATSLGRLWEAEYQLFRVVHQPTEFVAGRDAAAQEFHQNVLEKIKQAGGVYLEQVARRMREGSLCVQTQVALERNPAAAILEQASQADCDVIAIATHGRGGLPRLLLGSIADKVVRGSVRPVLVYRPGS